MRAERSGRRGRLAGAVGTVLKATVQAGALVACLILAGAAVPGLIGYKTMIVTGGSMEPVIAAGDAVLLKPAPSGDIRPGDVITFHPLSGPNKMTTHRVVATTVVGGRPHFQTKGDANRTPDPDLAPAENVLGRVTVRIPLLGYLLYYAATSLGRLLLIALPAGLVAITQVRAMHARRRSLEERDWDAVVRDLLPARTSHRLALGARLGAILPIAIVGVFLGATILGRSAALYTDAGSVGSNSLATATLEPPTSYAATAACDGTNSAKATLTWTATTSTFADGYDIFRGTAIGGPYTNVAHVNDRTTTTFTNTGLAVNTTYYFVAKATASNWTSVNSVEASAITPASCP